jgi:hypothetical protein
VRVLYFSSLTSIAIFKQVLFRWRSGVTGRNNIGKAEGRMSSLNYMELCRLCLVKERVSIPIFEGEGDVRQIFLKIASCLPVKVSIQSVTHAMSEIESPCY